MEQSENAATRFDCLFGHTPAFVPMSLSLELSLLSASSVTETWMFIKHFNLLSVIALLES